MPEEALGQDQTFDPDVDRYPEFVTVLRRIMQEADLPEGPIDRFECTCLANGDATYNVWSARDSEPKGGFLPSSES